MAGQFAPIGSSGLWLLSAAMKAAVAFILALLMGLASVPMAQARGHAAPVMWVELCSGHQIALDAQGRAVKVQHCPDCIPGHAALPADTLRMPPMIIRFRPVERAEPANPVARAAVIASVARGPPVVA